MSVTGTVNQGVAGARSRNGVLWPVLITTIATAIGLAGKHWFKAVDYVGRDNDDVMRLVQIRDLMGGQGWFDLTQYRLGLEDGTLMHWSRLVDVPIANLIGFFSQFLDPLQAEAAALFVWPLLLLLPLFTGVAIAARHLGGRDGMLVALALTALFALTQARFQPGAIDHHNVQMVLIALIAAGLTDREFGRFWYGLAGVAAGLAVAVGAETVPVVGICCAAVAIAWAAVGERARNAACAFGLAFAATLTACFYLLVPPNSYGVVVCDGFSAGFYVLGTVGGGVLFLSAALASRRSLPLRFGALAVGGVAVGVATVLIAPQCLQSPLADLDPLLKTMWLDHVTEAKSILSLAQTKPEAVAGHFAVPVIALAVCIWQGLRSDRRVQYWMLAAVIGLAFAISLVQVRGAVFANLLAILPLAALVGEKRAALHATAKPGLGLTLQFAVLAIFSAQIVWSMIGLVALKGAGSAAVVVNNAADPKEACATASGLASLAAQPPGVVSAVTNMGSDILRYTPHRALAAPYHRNQGGMLTQLHIAMADTVEAEAFLRGAGVTLVAFCPTDPEAIGLARIYPDSLTAALMAGEAPSYLQPVEGAGPIALYRLSPQLGNNWSLK